MLETVKAKLIGVSPLLMHNIQLADPLSEAAQALKEVTKKRKKSDEELLEIRRLEWLGGLYLDENGAPALPADMILAAVVAGARKSKLGKDAQAGVFETQAYYPLDYDGPRDIAELYQTPGFVDVRAARVTTSRVMRTRPRFPRWSVDIALSVNTEVINLAEVWDALEIAGERSGLGDHRPRFGRFTVEGRPNAR